MLRISYFLNLTVCFFIFSLTTVLLSQPEGWSPVTGPSSGGFMGQATIDGVPAGEGDWAAAFDEITGNSFDFYSRQYDGTGASTVDVCKPGSTIQSDFEYYLARRSVAIIDDKGLISILDGSSSEIPQSPDLPAGVMKLAEIRLLP